MIVQTTTRYMVRKAGKRADNDKETAKKLAELRRLRTVLNLTMRQIGDIDGMSQTTVAYLFYDDENAKRYHTENNIDRALKNARRIQRGILAKLK